MDYIGRSIEMKITGEKGIILEYNYLSEVNHYYFKIKIKDKEIITFNEQDFILV